MPQMGSFAFGSLFGFKHMPGPPAVTVTNCDTTKTSYTFIDDDTNGNSLTATFWCEDGPIVESGENGYVKTPEYKELVGELTFESTTVVSG